LVDKPGLITTGVKEATDGQRQFSKDEPEWQGKTTDLLSVVNAIHPNVLVGTSTAPGSFTKEIVKAMASHVDRPIILPLSNPTRLHEAIPQDLLDWTNGKALVATGSPFKPVKGNWGENGSEIEIDIAECNNSVVFPGIGLGAVLCRAKQVTDKMLISAVEGIVEMSPALKDLTQPLLPGVDAVREASLVVARKVIITAVEEGMATERDIPSDMEDLEEWIREQMWDPVYRELKLVEMEGASREARGELKVVGSVEYAADS
jgi:malate dehydrogenase (oxaloacetate-decarboxylating)